MTTNPFNELLVSVFEQEKQEKEQKAYTPSKKKQVELKKEKYELIAVINNSINPFSPEFDPYNSFDGVAFARSLRSVIPLSDSTINKLSKEGIDTVVNLWYEAVNTTIKVFKEEIRLKDVYDLNVDELQAVFTEPIIKHTKSALQNKRYSASNILEDIYMNMAGVTNILSPQIKRKVQRRYYTKLSNQLYTQTDIQNYQKLKYKPLDGMLTDVLIDGNFKEFAEKIQKLDKFLDFVNIPVETILNQSLLLIQKNIEEVAKLKAEWEQLLVLREHPEYKKPVYAFHNDALRKINKARGEYEQLHDATYKALKTLAKVHDGHKASLKCESLKI